MGMTTVERRLWQHHWRELYWRECDRRDALPPWRLYARWRFKRAMDECLRRLIELADPEDEL